MCLSVSLNRCFTQSERVILVYNSMCVSYSPLSIDCLLPGTRPARVSSRECRRRLRAFCRHHCRCKALCVGLGRHGEVRTGTGDGQRRMLLQRTDADCDRGLCKRVCSCLCLYERVLVLCAFFSYLKKKEIRQI